MRVLLVHNQYRSATPSGENRVVDQGSAALASAGHEVTRFGRSNDDTEHWSMTKKASLPAGVSLKHLPEIYSFAIAYPA